MAGLADRICPPEQLAQPEINYLAKDYASFRQLMLDRLALLVPDWADWETFWELNREAQIRLRQAGIRIARPPYDVEPST